jgi:hypothetical protein
MPISAYPALLTSCQQSALGFQLIRWLKFAAGWRIGNDESIRQTVTTRNAPRWW